MPRLQNWANCSICSKYKIGCYKFIHILVYMCNSSRNSLSQRVQFFCKWRHFIPKLPCTIWQKTCPLIAWSAYVVLSFILSLCIIAHCDTVPPSYTLENVTVQCSPVVQCLIPRMLSNEQDVPYSEVTVARIYLSVLEAHPRKTLSICLACEKGFFKSWLESW